MHSALCWESKEELQKWVLNSVGKQSFESYNWSSFDKNKKLLESYYSKNPSESPVFPSQLETHQDKSLSQVAIHVAETVFGSWPTFLEFNLDLNININKILSEVRTRHNSVIYFLENSILSKKKSRKVWDTMIEPIIYEMSHTELNSRKESVAGFQYRNKLTKQTIIDFPFDAMIAMNSSLGRLYIIDNYNKLTSHPDLVKTRTSGHIFGFSLTNNDEVYRKYN